MSTLIFSLILLCAATPYIYGQQYTAPDSVSTHHLETVVVRAPREPDYKRGVIPAAGSTPYTIRLPLRGVSKLDDALINLRRNHKEELSKQIAEAQEKIKQAPAPTQKSKAPQGRYKTYKVRRGDTLSKIAKQHGVSVAALKRANGLKGRNPKLRPGQRLKIPR